VRHRVYGRHLNRDKNERTALFRGLIRHLILNESITTTESKAKAIKGLVDKLISRSKQDTNAAKNVIMSNLPQKEVTEKLIKEIGPRYQNRQSGFTNTVRLGTRKGDGTMMVKMSLVEEIKETSKKKAEEVSSKEEPRSKTDQPVAEKAEEKKTTKKREVKK
jgi:large subunit ribosomal protein L17